jgi:hypothetical protein
VGISLGGIAIPYAMPRWDCDSAQRAIVFDRSPHKGVSLEISGQCLQICYRHPISRLPVIKGIARKIQRILCVHYLEHSSLSRLVAKRDQTHTICGQFSRATQRFKLLTSRLCLVVKGPQVSEQLPLRETQFHPRLVSPKVSLLQFAAI